MDRRIIDESIAQRCDVLYFLEPQRHNLSHHEVVEGLPITPPMEFDGQKALNLNLIPTYWNANRLSQFHPCIHPHQTPGMDERRKDRERFRRIAGALLVIVAVAILGPNILPPAHVDDRTPYGTPAALLILAVVAGVWMMVRRSNPPE